MLTGLQPDVLYTARVQGVNEAGNGPFSPPSEPVFTLGLPTVAPAAPTGSAATTDSIHVSWQAAEGCGDHDAPLTGYCIRWSAEGEPESFIPRDATSGTFNGGNNDGRRAEG